MKRRDVALAGAGVGAFYGALGGAGLGNLAAQHRYDRSKPAGRDLTVSQRDAKTQVGTLKGLGLGMLAGGAVGALGGSHLYARERARRAAADAEWDAFRGRQKAQWDDFFKGFGGRTGGGERARRPPPPSSRSHGTLAGMLGFDPNKVSTKAEVKKAYRTAALKHHPDRGGDPKKMGDINQAYEDIQTTGWFQKLAHLQHENGGRFSALMFTVG